MDFRFRWDHRKAASNARKHGVSFSEACTVFSDPVSITRDDPDAGRGDDRFLLIGRSARDRLLAVVHAELRDAEIRLISARPADRDERARYEEASKAR
jgi:uncharacterized DUF497 family protein